MELKYIAACQKQTIHYELSYASHGKGLHSTINVMYNYGAPLFYCNKKLTLFELSDTQIKPMTATIHNSYKFSLASKPSASTDVEYTIMHNYAKNNNLFAACST